jgi:hypothetical protein
LKIVLKDAVGTSLPRFLKNAASDSPPTSSFVKKLSAASSSMFSTTPSFVARGSSLIRWSNCA